MFSFQENKYSIPEEESEASTSTPNPFAPTVTTTTTKNPFSLPIEEDEPTSSSPSSPQPPQTNAFGSVPFSAPNSGFTFNSQKDASSSSFSFHTTTYAPPIPCAPTTTTTTVPSSSSFCSTTSFPLPLTTTTVPQTKYLPSCTTTTTPTPYPVVSNPFPTTTTATTSTTSVASMKIPRSTLYVPDGAEDPSSTFPTTFPTPNPVTPSPLLFGASNNNSSPSSNPLNRVSEAVVTEWINAGNVAAAEGVSALAALNIALALQHFSKAEMSYQLALTQISSENHGLVSYCKSQNSRIIAMKSHISNVISSFHQIVLNNSFIV